VTADNDQVDFQFLGFFGDGFRNPALQGFEQQRFGIDAFGLLHRLGQQLVTGGRQTGDSSFHIDDADQWLAVQVEQGFIGNVGDIDLGVAGAGNMQGFGQGALRGGAVVDGDHDFLVHQCSPEGV